MEAFENSLLRFQPIPQDKFDGFVIIEPSVSKYIFSALLLPEILDNISNTFRILEVEGNRILSCQNHFSEYAGSEALETDKDRFFNFGEENKLFKGYKRIFLVNSEELITIDFCLLHMNNTGRLNSFDSMVILSVYRKNDKVSSSTLKLLENFTAPREDFLDYDINLLLLYSLVKLNMSKSKIWILDDLIQ